MTEERRILGRRWTSWFYGFGLAFMLGSWAALGGRSFLLASLMAIAAIAGRSANVARPMEGRTMRGNPAELRDLVWTMLPHDPACCDRGVDHAFEDRTYVCHETATRRWGFTVLRDGKGTIVDRWGNPP